MPMTHSTRRHFLIGAGAFGGAALLTGCETNKALGRSTFSGFYTLDDDVALGRKEYPKLIQQFGGAYDNPKIQRYVDDLGKKLAANTEYPQFPYTVTVADTPIVNAFALPGGFVTVTRGLLSMASSEAELAGVLSHELGHVNARHGAERLAGAQAAQVGMFGLSVIGAVLGVPGEAFRLAQQGLQAYIQSYSRKQEFEADSLAVRYMSRGGYDPQAMVSFLETLREQSIVDARTKGIPEGKVDEFNIMSTHPRTVDRVEAAIAQSKDIDKTVLSTARHEYLNEIDGMTFGDSPQQGIVNGPVFSHPEMKFTFRVPDEFVLFNQPDRVLARHPNETIITFDAVKIATVGLRMTDYIRGEWAKKHTVAGLEAITVNDLEAATGAVRLRIDGTTKDIRLVAIHFDHDTVYRFQFVTDPDKTAVMASDLQRTTYSFRRLADAEAAAIGETRIRIRVSKPGDTVASLSRALPYGKFNADYFRLLNDMKDGEELTPGRRIKVVETVRA